jgi:tetratricopeptide (TPR) repeat protein
MRDSGATKTLHWLVLVILAACLPACASAPGRSAWFDGCQALHDAARKMVDSDPATARLQWDKVLADEECKEFYPRCRFHLARMDGEGGNSRAFEDGLVDLARLYPDSYWGRRAVEELWTQRVRLGDTLRFVKALSALYAAVNESTLAGHVLFYLAQAHLQADQPSPARALYHLLILVDYYPHSALWDDGLWAAADVLNGLGRPGDEVRVLELALVPNSARGIDALADGFTGQVRLRLGRLYRRQGRYVEAERQLSLVINIHPSIKLKDDAFWELARVYRFQGDRDREVRALDYLVRFCPWSRHVKAARQRLQSRRVTE